MAADVTKLTDLPLFALLGEEERGTLTGLLSRVRFERGEVIFAYGDPGDSVYLVSKGRVQIFMEDVRGERIVLAENGPGSFFGEISLLDGGPRTAGALALVDTELLTLDRDDLLEFITRHPPAALGLLTVMGQRLRSTNELLRTHTSRNINDEEKEKRTLPDRLTDHISSFAGSWAVLIILVVGVISSVVLVTTRPSRLIFGVTPFEWLSFALLALIVLQGMIILMARNRQAAKDRLKADLDYQFNLKAELEIAHLSHKFDEFMARSERQAGVRETERTAGRS
jgi:CRP/FNR family transcriptional regulator, cyclic AMP receptor protein